MADGPLSVRRPRDWPRLASAVHRAVTAHNGAYAASAFTLVAFVSLFPLALLVISILGLLAGSNPHLIDDLVSSLGLTGPAASSVRDMLHAAQQRGAAGSIIGLGGLAWTGLSLVGALQFVVNLHRSQRIQGIRARLLGVPWLLGAAVVGAVSLALSTVIDWLPGWTAPLAIVLSLTVDGALFLWTFWFLDVKRPVPRTLLPGALVAAVGFEVLKLSGTLIVPRLVANSSAVYGSAGVVFAILAWLLVFGRLLVYSTMLNAVLATAADDRSGSALVDPTEDAE